MDSQGDLRMASYVAGARRRALERHRRVETLRQRAFAALPAMVSLLTESFGVSRVWLFGSLVWGGLHSESDIDLAVEGLAPEDLLRAGAAIEAVAPCPVDLVRLEEVPESLARRVLAEGRCLYDGPRG